MKTVLEKAFEYKFKDPCIYFLLQSGKVVYVGKSNMIGSRVKTHQADKSFDQVKYFPVPRIHQDFAEMAFIKACRPKYNKQPLKPMTLLEERILETYGYSRYTKNKYEKKGGHNECSESINSEELAGSEA